MAGLVGFLGFHPQKSLFSNIVRDLITTTTYIHIYIYIYTHTRTHTHIYMFLCMCIYVHFIHFIFNFIFWLHPVTCGILVPRPGIEPVPPAVEARSLNHWTAREVHTLHFYLFIYFNF